ncbi:hypothetical protein RvY_09645 [Ramazzottius varieornatus]|uniref:Tetraspanin n=1 Tax=Ramazzottius varieornatus TaxID=947166 RepID=A0A1D1VJ39_RAMVA|nr:hypothetical protein RvY_09645 [Ramazzottius varieornatus]
MALEKNRYYVVSKFILFFVTILYFMFGVVLFGLSVWILADPNQGKYVRRLRLRDVQAGAGIILTSSILLVITSFVGCAALNGSKKPKTMTAYFALQIITLILLFSGSIFMLARTKSYQSAIDWEIERAVLEYDNRGPNRGEAEEFLDVLQTHLMCCGGESPNDYRIRGIPESCRRPWLSGTSQMWGCKEVTKRWIKYNTDATAGVGLFVCSMLIFGAISSWTIRRHYIDYNEIDRTRGRPV